MSFKLGIKEHIIDMEVADSLTIKEFSPLHVNGWGINLYYDEEGGEYFPEAVAYINCVSDQTPKMLPVVIVTPTEHTYESFDEAIVNTYFAGIRILGERVMPDIMMFDTNGGDMIGKFSLTEILETTFKKYEADGDDEVETAMKEKSTAVVH